MPTGTVDVAKWLADHYEFDSLGIAEPITFGIQLREAGLTGGFGPVLLLLAFPIMERRRPG